jgi:hypothetical protein
MIQDLAPVDVLSLELSNALANAFGDPCRYTGIMVTYSASRPATNASPGSYTGIILDLKGTAGSDMAISLARARHAC